MIERVPSRVHRVEEAKKRFGPLLDLYAQALHEVDPKADAVASDFADAGRGRARAWLEQALGQGIARVKDAPRSLVALFAELDNVPPWADFQRMTHGAHVFQRMGVAATLTLSAYSLMSGYHSAAAVKPLAFTGDLIQKAPRRLAETGRYITHTIELDGMRRWAEGFKSGVRVRLMHAEVRRRLWRSGKWDEAAWGAPINQADTALTAMEFCSMVLKGARALGHSFTDAESADVMHLWRYAAHVQGLSPRLLECLATEERAVRYEELVRFVSDGPDGESIALAKALREAPFKMAETSRDKVVVGLLSRIHDGLAWALNGDEVARDLEIPNRVYRHVIPLIRVAFAPVDRMRANMPILDTLLAHRGRKVLERQVEHGLMGVRPTFEVAGALSVAPVRKVLWN